ncbi:unnamed protein product [Phytophthora fragariaefolia]|uniref:Unnamed protein product n=1 Tax=Phytophthora fragariaefolia TaxID=1490495 RepID=A0A9W7CQA1_9STRA|nr:unnamed protein product [Phytophthora fragariaefolia]
MDTPRWSTYPGMMITTAIPGMISTLIPTSDRGANPNDDRSINSKNDRGTNSKDDHNDDQDCDRDTNLSSDRDADPKDDHDIDPGSDNDADLKITIPVRITIVGATLTSIPTPISDTWYRLSGTPELMAPGSQCEALKETQEMPDLLATYDIG